MLHLPELQPADPRQGWVQGTLSTGQTVGYLASIIDNESLIEAIRRKVG
jgi:hypothetical protein